MPHQHIANNCMTFLKTSQIGQVNIVCIDHLMRLHSDSISMLDKEEESHVETMSP